MRVFLHKKRLEVIPRNLTPGLVKDPTLRVHQKERRGFPDPKECRKERMGEVNGVFSSQGILKALGIPEITLQAHRIKQNLSLKVLHAFIELDELGKARKTPGVEEEENRQRGRAKGSLFSSERIETKGGEFSH
jgi:hypothetical protein